jgi:hypothetical protein
VDAGAFFFADFFTSPFASGCGDLPAFTADLVARLEGFGVSSFDGGTGEPSRDIDSTVDASFDAIFNSRRDDAAAALRGVSAAFSVEFFFFVLSSGDANRFEVTAFDAAVLATLGVGYGATIGGSLALSAGLVALEEALIVPDKDAVPSSPAHAADSASASAAASSSAAFIKIFFLGDVGAGGSAGAGLAAKTGEDARYGLVPCFFFCTSGPIDEERGTSMADGFAEFLSAVEEGAALCVLRGDDFS